MHTFKGNVVSVKVKQSRYGNGHYLGILAQGQRDKVWFAAPESFFDVLCDDAEIAVEFETFDRSDDGRLAFLKKATIVAVDGEPQKRPAPKRSAIREPAQVGSFQGVVDLLTRAHTNLKFPKIKISLGDRKIKLYRAGERSKYCGQVQVCDDAPFGQGRYYGRVDADGAFHASSDGRALEGLTEMLAELAENPAGAALKHARRTGNCCFCARDLVDPRSVSMGYGPICADHYGLPWGEVVEVPAEA